MVAGGMSVIAIAIAYLALTEVPNTNWSCSLRVSMICFEFAGSPAPALAHLCTVAGEHGFLSEKVEALQAELGMDYGQFIPFYIVMYTALAFWIATGRSRKARLLAIGMTLTLIVLVCADLAENAALQKTIDLLRAYTVEEFSGVASLPADTDFMDLKAAGTVKWIFYGLLSILTGSACLTAANGGRWLVVPGLIGVASGLITLAAFLFDLDPMTRLIAVTVGFVGGFSVLLSFGFLRSILGERSLDEETHCKSP